MLRDNGSDYHILTNAVRQIKGIPGLVCEVGLREGGGIKHIVDTLLECEDFERPVISIDPYGGLPYIQTETTMRWDGPYQNSMMTRTLSELYGYVHNKKVHVLFFPLEDTEFFVRFAQGVPIYHRGKKTTMNNYALSFLDGPHNLDYTMNETVFFAERSVPGSLIVYDDVKEYYNHDEIKNYLTSNGWKTFESAPSKISYMRSA